MTVDDMGESRTARPDATDVSDITINISNL